MRPFSIVSLWDVLKKFNAEYILTSLSYMAGMQKKLAFARERITSPQDAVCFDIEEIQDLLSAAQNIEIAAHDFALPGVGTAAKDLKDYIRRLGNTKGAMDHAYIGQLIMYVEVTLASFVNSISERYIFVVSGDAAKLLDDGSCAFGSAVEDAFPSVQYDVTEASKCRALERWTSSVMHLMRILEVGLGCLASFAGVDPNENWNTLLNQIESELKKVGKRTHSPEEEQFAAEAATHFRAIKNAWRNHAMHAREKYDEERAVAIYDSTRSFMQHLATRLAE